MKIVKVPIKLNEVTTPPDRTFAVCDIGIDSEGKLCAWVITGNVSVDPMGAMDIKQLRVVTEGVDVGEGWSVGASGQIGGRLRVFLLYCYHHVVAMSCDNDAYGVNAVPYAHQPIPSNP